jgi:hypothetical protein
MSVCLYAFFHGFKVVELLLAGFSRQRALRIAKRTRYLFPAFARGYLRTGFRAGQLAAPRVPGGGRAIRDASGTT